MVARYDGTFVLLDSHRATTRGYEMVARYVITLWDADDGIMDTVTYRHGDDQRAIIRNFANYLTSPTVYSASLEYVEDTGYCKTIGTFNRNGLTE